MTKVRHKSKHTELIVVIDLGSSGIKVASCIKGSRDVKTLFLPAEIIEIDEEVAKGIEFHLQDFINGIWIKVDNKFYAMGTLAQRLMATAVYSQSKSKFACEKIAAIVWVLAKYFDLPKTEKNAVKIICLLPPGEMRERNVLGTRATEVLENFDAPDGHYSVRVTAMDYFPEGIGIYEHFQSWYGTKYLDDVKIGIVMMGHRNTSFFCVCNGRIATLRSSEMGFWRIIQDLGLPITDKLAEATSSWLAYSDDKKLYQLLLSRGVVNPNESMKGLKTDIDRAMRLQSRAIIQWLTEIVSTSPIDIALIAGGAADSFKKDLVEYFDAFLPDLPGSNSKEAGIFFHGGKAESLSNLEDNYARNKDILGLWASLHNKV